MPSPSPPSPLLPAAPAAAATRRRRRLLSSTNPSSAPASAASSSSSASSSTSSCASFSFPSPAPSPFHHRFLSPLRASAVPFSWEHRPGIPKTPARGPSTRTGKLGASAKAPPLPLPPSLFSSNSRVVAEYPFAATAAYSEKARRRGQQRRWPAVTGALADWLAVLSLYRSCTRSRDCLAAAGPPPQPRRRVPA
uniref:Uncharacterized protein n=1 Tax=Avena sativa TaxID=4498 RepID=A0ACD5UPS3_AVESA